MKISGIIFDFDGTLTAPGSIDFAEIRNAVGCPDGIPVLEYIGSLPDPEQRRTARKRLHQCEIMAADRTRPNQGAEELVRVMRDLAIPLAIITRNSRVAVQRSFTRFSKIKESDFTVILTRDDAFPPKPAPDSLLIAMKKMDTRPKETLMVGDYVFDIEAGQRAGCPTALTRSDPVPPEWNPDFTVANPAALLPLILPLVPLPMGKLPNRLLADYLDQFSPPPAPDLLLPPGVGRDCAIVQIPANQHILSLKTDPITFPTQNPGHYAIQVNANDLATAGAIPRWFLATLLLPPGTTGAEIKELMRDLQQAAEANNILVCGGHTEITDAVTRPVISGLMAGMVATHAILNPVNAGPGDELLLAGAIAIEGTAILAREMKHPLQRQGISEKTLIQAEQLVNQPGISIIRAATIARNLPGIIAMHDVTEGGLATAVREISTAAGQAIRVKSHLIPILPETQKICAALGLNPLGLIGSGALLVLCRRGRAESILAAWKKAGIPGTKIGIFQPDPPGVQAIDEKGENQPWPEFAVDEIARALSTPPATP